MIDTHAHLNIRNYKNNIDEVLNHAKEFGVNKIIVIGMNGKTNKIALNLAKKHPMLYATVGLHPSYADEGIDFDELEKDLQKDKVVAVGECGIDLHWRVDNLERQKEMFIKQIELSIKLDLPLIIHARNSFDEIYNILINYKGRVKGVFHCFSSSLGDALKVIDELGFYLGVDGPVTYNNAHELREIIKVLPLKHFLIETDSPYLTPAAYRGKENKPGYVLEVAKKISEIKNISLEEVINITTNNAKNLFNI